MVNVIVKNFPEQKWRRFRIEAIKRGKTVKEALEEAVEAWCDNG